MKISQALFGLLCVGVFGLLIPTSTAAMQVDIAKFTQKVQVEGDILPCLDTEDYDERIACFSTLCDPSYACTEALLIESTALRGPVVGTKVLDDLMTSSAHFGLNTDGHELGHIIGRTTAKVYGITGDAFLQCPNDYLYACPHGFFEQAMIEADGPTAEVAERICETITEEPVSRNRFYCYHGVGHGIMMAKGNDIYESIRNCNTMPYLDAARGCWQGAFMENINADITETAREGVFRKDDPLAPCSRVPLKYQWNCYENHSAHLMKVFGNDILLSADACLEAHQETRPSCVLSLAQLATNPGWQTLVLAARPELGGEQRFIRNSVKICMAFPEEIQTQCHYSAVVNALNYHEIEQALEYCSYLNGELQSHCYQVVGNELYYHARPQEERNEWCSGLTGDHYTACTTPGSVPDMGLPPTTGDWQEPEGDAEEPVINIMEVSLRQKFVMPLYFFREMETVEENSTVDRLPASLVTTESIQSQVLEGGSGKIGDRVIRLVSSTTFEPSEVTISAGETVTWINETSDHFWPASDVHPTHELLSSFDARKPLSPEQSYSYTFTEVGEWSFHDHLNPQAIGVVHVLKR